ncbi:MAG: 30S ribosomal protein S16 [Bdellovibrionota bacterium]|nr:30S ribosomal protein S16 [Pseudobdellovibrionaceae bacterium]MEC9281300.1 30S ribosomal protein S16 [Bdellovibrionota bacterium]|tara:strand:+ start:4453 stop:4698 length:246 start_codon:yes stop_codon:yes gene_type:complete
MVVIRLQRCGRTHAAKYRLVAADSRRFRDGKFLEILGQFNPSPRGKEEGIRLDEERVNYWLEKGAQASERVKSILREVRKN